MAKSELIESDKDQERRWKIEEAARVLKEYARLKNRDKKLFAAAITHLNQEIADSKKLMQTTKPTGGTE